MIEHVYSIRKSSWWIHIKIIGEIRKCSNAKFQQGAIKVAEGIWLKFADKTLVENEIFCGEDLSYFVKGLKLVQEEIQRNSLYDESLIIFDKKNNRYIYEF